MLSLSQKIQALYPDLQEPEDWEGIVLVSTAENPEPYIAQWTHSTLAKPTEAQLAAVDEADYVANVNLKVAKANRASAYRSETDPLFFQYQAGEVTKEEWLAKREEIRARYPYPTS